MHKGYHGNSSMNKQNHTLEPQIDRICFTFREELFLADLLFVFECFAVDVELKLEMSVALLFTKP
jgi:hypothetical protein